MLKGDPATVARTVKVASSDIPRKRGITRRSKEVRIMPAPMKLTAAQPTAQGNGAAGAFQSGRSDLIPCHAMIAVELKAIDSAIAGSIAVVIFNASAMNAASSK